MHTHAPEHARQTRRIERARMRAHIGFIIHEISYVRVRVRVCTL